MHVLVPLDLTRRIEDFLRRELNRRKDDGNTRGALAVNALLDGLKRSVGHDKMRYARDGFRQIADLSVNLRSGGPDSGDLHDLSDALDTAVSIAIETLEILEAGR